MDISDNKPDNNRPASGDLIGFLALVNCKLILPFEELFRGELTNLQLLTLCSLRLGGEMPVKTLGERLYLSKQQMTKVISRLCEDGFVERKKHPSDGRVVLVRLSEKSARLFDVRREQFSTAANRVIEQYDCKQDVERFNELITELSRILSALPSHSIQLADNAEQ